MAQGQCAQGGRGKSIVFLQPWVMIEINKGFGTFNLHKICHQNVTKTVTESVDTIEDIYR